MVLAQRYSPHKQLEVQYFTENENTSPTVVFSAEKIMEMRPLLLDESKEFDLIAFLGSRQVEVTN